MKIVDVYAQHEAIARMCAAEGVNLFWIPEDAPNQTPHAIRKSRSIHMPRIKSDYSDKQLRIHRATVWHENGHLDKRQEPMWDLMDAEKVDMRTYRGKCLNAVNDDWQEMETSRKYLGAAQDLEWMAGVFCQKGAEGFRKGLMVDDPFMGKLLAWHYLVRSRWQTTVELYVEDWLNNYHLPEAWLELADDANDIIEIDDDKEAARECLRIADALLESDPDSPEPTGKPDGDGDAGEGGDPSSGEGEGSEDGEGGEGGKAKVSYKDLMGHWHNDDESESKHTLEIEYDHAPSEYVPAGPDELYIGRPTGGPSPSRLNAIKRVRETTAQVSGGIRRLFQSESQTKKLGFQKRGRLTGKDLAKLPAGETRVFHKKINRLAGVADVEILVDASGSMERKAYAPACNAAISLAEALSAANIPTRVCAFTENLGTVQHLIIKDWSEPATFEKMGEAFSSIQLWDNADGDNIMASARELLKRPNKRKVMVVMSDGMPCTSREGDAYAFTKKAVKHCIASGIEMYGIGIMSRHVASLYPKWAHVDKPSEIEAALSKLITECILEN